MKVKKAAIACTLLTMPQAYAQDAVPNTWSKEVELGLVTTGGNSNTDAINARANATNERTHWRNKGVLGALYTQNNNTTTAAQYNASAKSKYKIDNHQYVFGIAKYGSEKFSGYDYRAIEAMGYGQRVIANESVVLDLEVGPGARQSKPNNETSNHKKMVWLNGDLSWNIDKETSLSEEISAEIAKNADNPDSANILSSATAFKNKINGSLAIKLTYALQYTSKVPSGVQKSDRKSTVTLVYNF